MERPLVFERTIENVISLKQRFTRIFFAALVLLACPGDDAIAVAHSLGYFVRFEMEYTADEVLGMCWTDQRTKERHEPLLSEDIELEEEPIEPIGLPLNFEPNYSHEL